MNVRSRYLEPLLQEAVRAGLLLSYRGTGGGYMLAKPANRITLADAARVGLAIESTPKQTRLLSPLGEEAIAPLFEAQRNAALADLESITFGALLGLGDKGDDTPSHSFIRDEKTRAYTRNYNSRYYKTERGRAYQINYQRQRKERLQKDDRARLAARPDPE